MCGMFPGPLNVVYVRDLTRGRLHDYERFYKIRKWAEDRWRKTHDMHYAKFWIEMLAEIDRRAPQ